MKGHGELLLMSKRKKKIRAKTRVTLLRTTSQDRKKPSTLVSENKFPISDLPCYIPRGSFSNGACSSSKIVCHSHEKDRLTIRPPSIFSADDTHKTDKKNHHNHQELQRFFFCHYQLFYQVLNPDKKGNADIQRKSDVGGGNAGRTHDKRPQHDVEILAPHAALSCCSPLCSETFHVFTHFFLYITPPTHVGFDGEAHDDNGLSGQWSLDAFGKEESLL